MTGGRPNGINATVIREHPLMAEFPHEGYCDWQFCSMMEGAQAVVFNDLALPFDPIVEIVSGYTFIRKQSSLFELKVGEGRLVVCTFILDEEDCGAQYLLHLMMKYLRHAVHEPAVTVSPKVIASLIREKKALEVDFSTDMGNDVGGDIVRRSNKRQEYTKG